MEQDKKDNYLFSEFPPVSTEQWEGKIHADLKGADYEKKLVWKTIDGINVKPYYRAEDLKKLQYLKGFPGASPFIRGQKIDNNDWDIHQNIESEDPQLANKAALDAINRGATSIGFRAKGVESVSDMEILLSEIDMNKIAVSFISSRSYPATFDLFMKEVKKQNLDLSKLKGSFNFDSLSYYLLYGKFYTTKDNDFVEATYLLKNMVKKIPGFKAITVNGQYFHNAGASIVQELAFSLSSGNEYLVQLTAKGELIDTVASHMQFMFAIGSNYFMEIAKLRAARMLWARIVEQYHPLQESSKAMTIHAVTSNWNKSIYDPHVNMLRTTTEAMSAAIGGCDVLTINLFDNTYKKSDDLSTRYSRNTQLILKSESYLDKIVDPAAGSYYIEHLTDSIAEAAWKLFKTIEGKGGFLETVKSNFIIEEITKICQQRDMDIAMRRQIILGTNQYPNMNERMLDKIKPHAELSDLGGLRQYRGAQAFETIRLATEAHVKDGHNRPKVFLLTIGNLAMRKARAAFAANFFGCAGYEILDNIGFKTVEEGVNDAIEANADIVVICSSDDEYTAFAPEACKLLQSKKPEVHFIVAGNPTAIIEELKKAGVDDFIHVRTNVIETLRKYNALLGI